MPTTTKKPAAKTTPAAKPSRFVKAIYIRADGTKKEVVFQAAVKAAKKTVKPARTATA